MLDQNLHLRLICGDVSCDASYDASCGVSYGYELDQRQLLLVGHLVRMVFLHTFLDSDLSEHN